MSILNHRLFWKCWTALFLLTAVMSVEVEAKSKRKFEAGEDSIKAGQVVRNGIVCKTQTIMVTGKARPTWPVNQAKGNAEALWQSTVTAIHGERFSDLSMAKNVDHNPLKARFNFKKYVVKGIPCAPSL